MTDLTSDLDFALALADAADAHTLPRFQAREFSVEWKDNNTEVTEVDRGCESLLTEMIRTQRPHHGWYGEEHGESDTAEWTWVIDPIDGTTNFVRGVPVWATLIALVHADLGPVLGVVSAPAMATRWWGGIDLGAYCNGHPIAVSNVARLADAHLSISDNAPWRDAGRGHAIKEIKRSVQRIRGFGDFWQHMLVAQGAIDVAVDAIGLGPYDIAALVPIVTAAGGRLTDRHGIANWRADTAITTNGVLHDDVIAILTK